MILPARVEQGLGIDQVEDKRNFKSLENLNELLIQPSL
jgi:hypothetical protein